MKINTEEFNKVVSSQKVIEKQKPEQGTSTPSQNITKFPHLNPTANSGTRF